MKIILSRKGFDSSSGGKPSPIFPDGKILSLPIPDKKSVTKYSDFEWEGINVGDLVSDLTNGKIRSNDGAHLDPDLRYASIERLPGWKPLLGQVDKAQSHLINQEIASGDLFVFFGLFKDIVSRDNKWTYKRKSLRRHLIWGWLQIGDIVQVDKCDRVEYNWAAKHPHFHRQKDETNTVYLASAKLALPNMDCKNLDGCGVLSKYDEYTVLTQNNSNNHSVWELPKWFYPKDGKPPLTYHGKMERWKLTKESVILNTVGRGQEFVLDCDYYPEAIGWIVNILSDASYKR